MREFKEMDKRTRARCYYSKARQQIEIEYQQKIIKLKERVKEKFGVEINE